MWLAKSDPTPLTFCCPNAHWRLFLILLARTNMKASTIIWLLSIVATGHVVAAQDNATQQKQLQHEEQVMRRAMILEILNDPELMENLQQEDPDLYDELITKYAKNKRMLSAKLAKPIDKQRSVWVETSSQKKKST